MSANYRLKWRQFPVYGVWMQANGVALVSLYVSFFYGGKAEKKEIVFFSVFLSWCPLACDNTWQGHDYCARCSLMPCNPRLNACQKSALNVSNYDITYTNHTWEPFSKSMCLQRNLRLTNGINNTRSQINSADILPFLRPWLSLSLSLSITPSRSLPSEKVKSTHGKCATLKLLFKYQKFRWNIPGMEIMMYFGLVNNSV